MFKKVLYTLDREDAYAFVTDEHLNALVHPLLPMEYTEDSFPYYIKIDYLEQQNLAANFTSHLTGKLTKTRDAVVPRGETTYVSDKGVRYTYQWRRVPDVKFYVCVVYRDDSATEVPYPVITQKKTESDTFVYHRMDLDANNDG